MSDKKCTLCHQPASKQRRLVRHHYRGRAANPRLVMLVHEGSCHNFGDWVTALYTEHGRIAELSDTAIVYLFHRIVTLRNDGVVILPI